MAASPKTTIRSDYQYDRLGRFMRSRRFTTFLLVVKDPDTGEAVMGMSGDRPWLKEQLGKIIDWGQGSDGVHEVVQGESAGSDPGDALGRDPDDSPLFDPDGDSGRTD